MNIIRFNKICIATICILCGWSCSSMAYAAQTSFATQPAVPAVGEEFTVDVYLDTQGDLLNGIEGSIVIPKNMTVEEIRTGGSGVSVWPLEPHFSPQLGTVEFFGGIRGGVSPHTKIKLFSIRAKVTIPGSYTLNTEKSNGYLHDGKGSRIPIGSMSYTFSVALHDFSSIPTAKDNIPPDFVTVEVGSDPALFDGHQYVTFFAVDNQSGVSYYEVQEGWFGHYIKADRYYVLSDQTRNSPIWVRAVDGANNTTVKPIPPQHFRDIILGIGGVVLVLIAGICVKFSRRKYQRTNS